MLKELFPDKGILTTLEDVLKSINCDFEAEQVPILQMTDTTGVEVFEPIKGYSCIRRGDNKVPLGIMSGRYGLLQYKDTMSFLNDIAGSKEASFRGATSTGDGAKVYVAMKSPNTIVFAPGDEMECYFVASSSHDGSGSVQLVCAPVHKRTQTIMTNQDFGVIKMRHTVKVKDRLARATGTVAKMQDVWNTYSDKFAKFANLPINDNDAQTYFAMVVPSDAEPVPTRTENVRSKLFDIYKSGISSSLPSCQNTLLGAFVASLVFGDYYKTVRQSIVGTSERDAMVESRLSGSAARFKADAFAACIQIARL